MNKDKRIIESQNPTYYLCRNLVIGKREWVKGNP